MDYPLLKNNLPPSIKKVWRNTSFLTLFILLSVGIIISGLIYYFGNFEGIIVFFAIMYFLVTILVFIISNLLIPFRYNYFRYEITDDDIIYQSGFFFRKITYVPINRIQHIETEQGPFLRKANLMELMIHTAATTHRIAGLSVEDTLNLREQIIEKMKEANTDV